MNPFPPVMVTPMPTDPAELSELLGLMRRMGLTPVYGRAGEVIGFDFAEDVTGSCIVPQAPPVAPRDKRQDAHDDALLEALLGPGSVETARRQGRPLTQAERETLDKLPAPGAPAPTQGERDISRRLDRIGDELARIGNQLEVLAQPRPDKTPQAQPPGPIKFPAGNGPDRT